METVCCEHNNRPVGSTQCAEFLG